MKTEKNTQTTIKKVPQKHKKSIISNKVTHLETRFLSTEKAILKEFSEMYQLDYRFDAKNNCVILELDMFYTVSMHYVQFAVFRKLNKDIFLNWLFLPNRQLDIFTDSLIDYVQSVIKNSENE